MVRLAPALSFYREELKPYFSSKERKPVSKQAAELRALAMEYRYIPYQYLRTGMYHRNFERGIRDYMPPRLVTAYMDAVNSAGDRELESNKVRLRRVLDEAGLPVVRELFSIERDGVVSDAAGAPLDAKGARAIVERHGEAVFVKPLRGTWGTGAHILARDEIPEDFPSGRKNIVVQPVIKQHPALKAVYPHAINTVRIDTLRTEEGIVSNAAVLRMGAGGAVVDNGSAGGLIAGLDLETGQVHPFARRKPKFGQEWFSRHPDTGTILADVAVPFWPDIRELVVRATELLPFVSLGWDVAVTPEGPVVIEANSKWDVNVMQLGWGGLGSTELGRRIRRHHGLPVRDEA